MTPDGPDRAWRARLQQALDEAVGVQQALAGQTDTMLRAADACWRALRGDRAVLIFGNGGSAAEAQHFAAELSGRFQCERRALPALALTTDTSVLTAVGNDYGFDRVFSRQIEAFGRRGDVAVALSTSGRSLNVVEGLRVARAAGLTTIAVTGPAPADLGPHADIVIAVAGPSPARIQEGHLTVVHIICDLVEASLVAEGIGR